MRLPPGSRSASRSTVRTDGRAVRRRRRGARPPRRAPAAALVVAAIVPIVPVTARNSSTAARSWSCRRTAGSTCSSATTPTTTTRSRCGPAATGSCSRPSPSATASTQPGAASGYFTRQAASFALAHPLGELALLGARRTCSCTAPRSRATPASTSRARRLPLVAPRPLDLPDGLLIPARAARHRRAVERAPPARRTARVARDDRRIGHRVLRRRAPPCARAAAVRAVRRRRRRAAVRLDAPQAVSMRRSPPRS